MMPPRQMDKKTRPVCITRDGEISVKKGRFQYSYRGAHLSGCKVVQGSDETNRLEEHVHESAGRRRMSADAAACPSTLLRRLPPDKGDPHAERRNNGLGEEH